MPKRKANVYDYPTDYLPTLAGPSYHPAHLYGVPGSSSNPILLDSPPAKAPAAKRQRKAKDPDAPVPEKRGAVLKKKCPKNIEERLERVLTQRRVGDATLKCRVTDRAMFRFFMVDRKRNGNELREEFKVLGSTGNVSITTRF